MTAAPAVPLAAVAVVLVRTAGAVNLGLVARACANLGVGDLRLVTPLCERDSDDARKFANHARHRLLAAPVFADLETALADRDLVIGTTARARDEELGLAIDAPGAAARWRALGAERPALVFGNEADGLSDAELRHCSAFLRLPTPGDYPSYNLSHAVVTTLHAIHVRLAAAEDGAAEAALASRGEVERLGRYWLGSLERFRYFRRTPLEQWRPRFEAMLRRWPLTAHDVVVLRGMLAQMNYVAFGDKADAMDRSGRAPGVATVDTDDDRYRGGVDQDLETPSDERG